MSQEALNAFRRKVEEMPALREKLQSARAKATMVVAAEEGFAISLEEARDDFTKADTELNDERLESIAGGLLQMPFARGDDTPT
jgi:predicted ribosomally synthesized peptide with nif11-like leader